MVIANPIYDIMFKRLMEDLPTARFFIETLIGETIDELQVKPQEYRYKVGTHETSIEEETYKLLTIYKLDYVATIKTGSGEHKKVLIEVQKARNRVDIMRFRNYLAEQYKLEDEVVTAEGDIIKKPLPIVTIYLLGFKLADIDSPAIKVERKYIDMILGQPILNKSEFIEQLTHNSFIVQIPRIRGKLQNRLDALLSVFEQKHFLDENGSIKEYNHSIDFPEVRRILDVLHTEGVDPARRKEIEDEIEAWRLIEGGNRNDFERFRLQIEQKDRQIEQERAEKQLIANALEKEKAEKDNIANSLAQKKNAMKAQQKELEELRKLLGKG